jgi:hypothetical protein
VRPPLPHKGRWQQALVDARAEQYLIAGFTFFRNRDRESLEDLLSFLKGRRKGRKKELAELTDKPLKSLLWYSY